MKKILLLGVLTFISLNSLSQTPIPNGVMGVKFGDSKDKVISTMSENNRIFDDENSKNDQLFFTGGTFTGEELRIVSFSFYEDKLYYIIVNLKTKENSSLDKIKEGLEYKYKAIPVSLSGYYIWDFDKLITILLNNDPERGVIICYSDTKASELKKKNENEKTAEDL